MKHLFLFGLMAAALGVSHAQTAAKPTYVALSLGVAHSDALDSLKSSDGLFDTRTTPVAYRLSVGRRWGPLWSTELSFTDWGKASFNAVPATGTDARGSVSAMGWTGWSVWRGQTELDLTWVTRIGLSFNQSHGVSRQTGFQDIDHKWSTWTPIYGLGLEYALPEDLRLAFTADITKIDVATSRPYIKFYALSLSKSF
ncbi:MAG: OmpA-like transrane domain [Pseudomonadota bacterium]|jgi:hypothetical protein